MTITIPRKAIAIYHIYNEENNYVFSIDVPVNCGRAKEDRTWFEVDKDKLVETLRSYTSLGLQNFILLEFSAERRCGVLPLEIKVGHSTVNDLSKFKYPYELRSSPVFKYL